MAVAVAVPVGGLQGFLGLEAWPVRTHPGLPQVAAQGHLQREVLVLVALPPSFALDQRIHRSGWLVHSPPTAHLPQALELAVVVAARVAEGLVVRLAAVGAALHQVEFTQVALAVCMEVAVVVVGQAPGPLAVLVA